MFPFEKILCPTDFSDPSLCGLKIGNEMALKFGSEIVAVNIHKPIPHLPSPRLQATEATFDITEYEKYMVAHARETLARICDEIFAEGVVLRQVVKTGRPADEILALAEEEGADAICIATHGRTGLSRMIFGSVAQRVVRQANCPVVTIRACD